jgi:hypothetical protein
MAGAIIIGQTFLPPFARYSTWGTLRTVFSQPYEGSEFNTEYPPYAPGDPSFKSAAPGSGLIRADRTKVQGFGTWNFEIAASNIQPNPSPPPFYVADWYLWLDWWDYDSTPESTEVPVEVQNQLIGQTVATSVGASITINSSLFTTPNGRQYFAFSSPNPQGYVVSVGKLTPIT